MYTIVSRLQDYMANQVIRCVVHHQVNHAGPIGTPCQTEVTGIHFAVRRLGVYLGNTVLPPQRASRSVPSPLGDNSVTDRYLIAIHYKCEATVYTICIYRTMANQVMRCVEHYHVDIADAPIDTPR